MMYLRGMIIGAVVALFITSCDDHITHQAEISVDGNWSYEEKLTYPMPEDSASRHLPFFLEIEHDRRYPFQNIYVRYSVDDDSLVKRIVKSYDLSDKSGRWYGDCKGERCTYLTEVDWINASVDSPKEIEIEQFTREAGLNGIHAIRLYQTKSLY